MRCSRRDEYAADVSLTRTLPFMPRPTNPFQLCPPCYRRKSRRWKGDVADWGEEALLAG